MTAEPPHHQMMWPYSNLRLLKRTQALEDGMQAVPWTAEEQEEEEEEQQQQQNSEEEWRSDEEECRGDEEDEEEAEEAD